MSFSITLLTVLHIDTVCTAYDEVLAVETGCVVLWGLETLFALGALVGGGGDDALLAVFYALGTVFADGLGEVVAGVTFAFFSVII